MHPEVRQALIARLHTVQDHLGRIVVLIESGEPCAEILRQVAAVQAALHDLRRQLIQVESQICMEILQNSDCQEQHREIVGLLLAMYQI